MSEDEKKGYSGPQRAAIFLLSLGEEGASTVMRHMKPKEVQAIGEAMASLGAITDDEIQQVVNGFAGDLGKISSLAVEPEHFTRRVMVGALGENKARTVLNEVMQRTNPSKGLEALKWMDARSVAALLRKEHPQIAAMALASLEAEHAAEVISLFHTELQTDVLYRLAKLDLVDAKALEELDEILDKQISHKPRVPPASFNGVGSAANILNRMNSESQNNVIEELKKIDARLLEKVSDKMFVFEDLLQMDDRSMQRLLREISVDQLVIALKGVSKKVQDKFFNNMSARAAEMLREDLQAKGPVKIAEVEASQKIILSTTAKLAENGDIALGGSGGGGDTVV